MAGIYLGDYLDWKNNNFFLNPNLAYNKPVKILFFLKIRLEYWLFCLCGKNETTASSQ